MLFIEREAPHNYHLSELGRVSAAKRRADGRAGSGRICPRNHAERAGAAEKAGMEKTEEIVLHLKASIGMKKMLMPLKRDIQLKVGAKTFELITAEPDRKLPHGVLFQSKSGRIYCLF